MKISEVKKLSVRERFLYWIKERHNIYLRRKAGLPKPWSDDEVFQNWSFTNPYRENDKVTIWYRDNIRVPMYDEPGVLFATIAFRWFNWPPTGEILLRENLLHRWNTTRAMKIVSGINGQVFTGAYNISNGGSTKPKLQKVCEDYLQPAWEACGHGGWLRDEMLRGSYERKITLADAHELLSTLPGYGGSGFYAAQAVCDLKYTKYLAKAPDWWGWCSPGPGSVKGLNLFLGGNQDDRFRRGEFETYVDETREWLGTKLPKHPPFHAQDVQNCFCEFFKYETVLAGGRAKRRYAGL